VWGLVIALGVTLAIVTGRPPISASPPGLSPVSGEIATETTETPEIRPEFNDETPAPSSIALDSAPDSVAAEPRSPVTTTDLATDQDLDPDSLTEADRGSQADPTMTSDPASPALTPREERDRESLPKIPEELSAPTPALALELAPPPLTPEQRLIAALQERIAAISNDYASQPETEAIVTTVRIDFARNHLEVELTDRWYDLDEAEQDRLAIDLHDRGEQFDFDDIDLVDASGLLVARPAAIGNAMIVMRRLRD